jgi:hypothetical protein
VAGDHGDSGFYAGRRTEAIPGVRHDVGELFAVGTEARAYGGLQSGRLGVSAGRESAVGEHHRDELRVAHQNIA